jgi:hypothetical protein
MPRPIPKPQRAEEFLVRRRRIAARYPVRRRRITGRMIAEAGGVNLATAGLIRQWARAQGRWPFADGKGARPGEVRPIGPSRLSGRDWS